MSAILQPRVVRRSTIAGEIPVSVDGRNSVARRKSPKVVSPPSKAAAA